MAEIKANHLYKIFGPDPSRALRLLEQGESKENILAETGMSVGVQDASFSVNDGEIFVVMGLSGSGKSTLVRLLNRLIEPTSGQIVINGRDITRMNRRQLIKFRRSCMGMVFQSFALMPHLNVLDNVRFGLKLAGREKRICAVRSREALEQVGLQGWEDSYPDQLSGGMRQRVGLARGLAVDPDILLMDEAFSALDPLIRTEMQDELLRLQDRRQRTIVFISHDLDEALRIGGRIAVMESGRIVQVGTPEEILRSPADEYVRSFFRGVDPAGVITAGDIAVQNQPTMVWRTGEGSPRAALERLNSMDREYGYVLDGGRRFLGIVSVDSLKAVIESAENGGNIGNAFLWEASAAGTDQSMKEILPVIASMPWPVPVVDGNNIYQGVVSKNRFLRTLCRTGEQTGSPDVNRPPQPAENG